MYLINFVDVLILHHTVVLSILEGLTRSWPIMPVHSQIPICTFSFSDNPLLTPQKDYMYQYPKFGCKWTTNMGHMAKSPFLQFFFLVFLLFGLNPSTSKKCKRYRFESLYTSKVR